MPLVPTAHLTTIRRQSVRTLPDTCDIVRLTETYTSGGVSTVVEVVLAAGVACRYTETLGTQDAEVAARQGVRIDAVLTLPGVQDVTAADRVTVTVGGVAFGTYEVSGVARRSFELGRRVYLRKVG